MEFGAFPWYKKVPEGFNGEHNDSNADFVDHWARIPECDTIIVLSYLSNKNEFLRLAFQNLVAMNLNSHAVRIIKRQAVWY